MGGNDSSHELVTDQRTREASGARQYGRYLGEYAGNSQQGQNVVGGPLVYSLMLGMSVGDVSGKAIANPATEELSHPSDPTRNPDG